MTNMTTLPQSPAMSITLSEFRNNPFCHYGIMDTLIANGFSTLGDVASITREEAMSIRGFGVGKVKSLMKFQKMLVSEKVEKVEKFYNENIAYSCLPSSAGDMSSKIKELLTGICEAYANAGKDEIALICKDYFLMNKSLSDVFRDNRDKLSITSERVRQHTMCIRNAVWQNSLNKIRIFVEPEFISSLESIKMNCIDKPISFLANMLGDECPSHCYTNLFAFGIVKCDRYTQSAITSDYLVLSEEGVRGFVKDVVAVVAELHNTVRPVSLDELASKMRSVRPDMPHSRLESILNTNSLIETTAEDTYQLKYDALYNYEKIARIIWEEKEVTTDRIDLIHAMKTGDAHLISTEANLAQQKFDWCRTVGKCGVWKCVDGGGNNGVSLREYVKDYVQSHDIIHFSEALLDVQRAGYSYPARTVRSYFIELCRVSSDDHDILCGIEKSTAHDDIHWMRKALQNTKALIMDEIIRIIGNEQAMHKSAVIKRILSDDSESLFDYRCVYNTLSSLEKRGYITIDCDNMVHINEDYVKDGRFDCEKVAKDTAPDHYKAVLAVLKSKIEEAPDKTCSLSHLKKACETILRPFGNPNLLYKIIDVLPPENIEKVQVGNNIFLRQIS